MIGDILSMNVYCNFFLATQKLGKLVPSSKSVCQLSSRVTILFFQVGSRVASGMLSMGIYSNFGLATLKLPKVVPNGTTICPVTLTVKESYNLSVFTW